MTITSTSGYVCARIESSVRAMYLAALNAGMMTETFGVVLICAPSGGPSVTEACGLLNVQGSRHAHGGGLGRISPANVAFARLPRCMSAAGGAARRRGIRTKVRSGGDYS